MAKLKVPLLSFSARRRLGDDVVFQRRGRLNIAGKRQTHPDARSAGQLSWRHMFQKVVSLWHALSPTERLAWESAARIKHMTGYAWFVSQALRPNPGIYLPLQGGIMQGAIDMAGFKIEDLPDPAADQEPVTLKYFNDNAPSGGYTEGARAWHDTTVSITSGGMYYLALNSDIFDTDNIHDPITNNSRLTCKTPGIYIAGANFIWQGRNGGRRIITIRLNGSLNIAYHSQTSPGADTLGQTLVTTYELAINDYLELGVYHNTGSGLDITSTASSSPIFFMQRIG